MPALRTLAAIVLTALALALLAPAPARAQITLNLRDVELQSFVQIVAEQTGRNFLLDQSVSGTVTVVAPTPVGPEALYEIFLAVLELNGLAILEGADVDRIVPIAIAPELAPRSARPARGGAFETRAIAVRNIALTEILDTIQPLLPPEVILSPIPSAGLIVISDRRENLDRIEALIRRLDGARTAEIETIRLANGRAADMLAVIQGLEILPEGATISADARTNAIIVAGPPELRARIRALVGQLDTPQRTAVSRVIRLNYATAAQLAEVLRASFVQPAAEGAATEITVVADPNSNAILVTAPDDRIDGIVDAVRALDVKPKQVLVEAVIFEMSAERFSDLSVQFGGILRDALIGGTSFALDGRASLVTLINAALAGRAVDPGNGLAIGGRIVGDDGQFGAMLTALARERNTRLLSTPAVLTLDNQEAQIVVAQNVPFVTGSFATVGDGAAVPDQPFQTIERQDVGLTLKVKPQITEDGNVRMAITQEVSNLTGSVAAAGGEITAKRTLVTNVIIGNGRVILLGGLMEESGRLASDRVPGLSRAPIIGPLFRGRSVQEGQRVLLVMLRPRVVLTDADANRLAAQHARETEALARRISPREDGAVPALARTGFPYDGVDINQPFDAVFVDKAVRERMMPGLPPRLHLDVGQ